MAARAWRCSPAPAPAGAGRRAHRPPGARRPARTGCSPRSPDPRRAAAGQVGVERAAVEDGQRDRRADASHARGSVQQVAGAHGLEAGEGGQVDVRIELGLGGVDGVTRGFGAPTRATTSGRRPSRSSGTLAGTPPAGATSVASVSDWPRCGRRRPAPRPGCAAAPAWSRPALVRPCPRPARFRLLDLDLRVQAGRVAAARRSSTSARCASTREHAALGEAVLQIEVGAHDGAGEQVARGLRIGRRGRLLRPLISGASGSCPRGPVHS